MPIAISQLRTLPYAEIGAVIERHADSIVQTWEIQARAFAPGEPLPRHRGDLIDKLPLFLRAVGSALVGGADQITHLQSAQEHGQQRWQIGWCLEAVVRDYQLLRVVLLEYLTERLARTLSLAETLAIGVYIDDAIAMAVRAHVDLEKRQLVDANRNLNEFLGVLAHELRNPVSVLSNTLELERIQGTGVENMQQTIKENSLRQITRLLEDMAAISLIARGKATLRREKVDLKALLECLAESLRPSIESAGLSMVLQSCPEEVWLDADPVRLSQVFSNLFSNAAKYSKPGDSITVRCDCDSGFAVVYVKDTGQGIAPELVPHVFDLFVQAPGNEDRGLGVGLCLVKQLVQAHGGEVKVRSAGRGLGSEFVVRLPLR